MAKEIILVDTNVLLRLLLRDIESQFETSKKIFEQIEKGGIIAKISLLVVNELIWILENYYHKDRGDYVNLVLAVLSMKGIKFLDADKKMVMKMMKLMLKYRLDFTDLYLWKIGKEEKIKLVSFDKELLKLK